LLPLLPLPLPYLAVSSASLSLSNGCSNSTMQADKVCYIDKTETLIKGKTWAKPLHTAQQACLLAAAAKTLQWEEIDASLEHLGMYA
jgi:hypothetical protein